MPIIKEKYTPEIIKEAICDCCGGNIPLNIVGHLTDHVQITGGINNKIPEAIICSVCVKEKLTFINIQYKENTIGHC